MAGQAGLAPARRVALGVTSERRRRDARARDLLRAYAAMGALDERDRALASRLVLGSVAAEGELDRVIDSHLRRGAKLEPRVRDALRLAVFEVLYLDTPDSVAASQGVELVRTVASRAAGLANAVLRRVAGEDVARLAASREALARGRFSVYDMAHVGGLPIWLCEAALGALGREGAASYAEDALAPALPTVAANRCRHSEAEAVSLLREAGCDPASGVLPGSILLGRMARLAPSGLVDAVDVLPCDYAAQEVALLARPRPGSRVLEVGQGRGTKTVLLESVACAAGGPCEVTAVEVDTAKSAAAARRMEKAGLAEHVRCVADDGRTLDALGDDLFDLVFVDAPCTGTGTLSRHPEIAWSLAESSVAGLSRLQLEMLTAASAHACRGGRLVYSTCSILAEENERLVEAFLSSPSGARYELVGTHRTAIPGADRHFCATFRRR